MSASESDVAPKANVPIRRKFRRETPSQNRVRPKGMFNMRVAPGVRRGVQVGIPARGVFALMWVEYPGTAGAAREKPGSEPDSWHGCRCRGFTLPSQGVVRFPFPVESLVDIPTAGGTHDA